MANTSDSRGLFFKQFPEGVLRMSSHGVILDMNQQAEQLLGWDKADLCHSHIHDYLCPQEAEFCHSAASCLFSIQLLKELFENIKNEQEKVKKFEQWWVKKDGEYISVDVKLFLIVNDNSKDSYEVILTFSDCSKQQFSEAETQRLSLFAELNPAPVLQLSEDAVIYYANPAMTNLMVKYEFSELGFPNILPQNIQQLARQCIETTQAILNIEQYYQGVWFNWNFHANSENDIPLVQAYGQNITAQKENQAHLKQLKELAEETNRQKTNFFANMNHELRTPLNGIIGMSNLIQETELDPIQFDYSEKIHKSAESLLMIINDILDISKIEVGKLEIDPVKFNLRELMYDTISVLEYQSAQKKLNLELRFDPQIPGFLIGDGLRIRQIILNFLNNAVKFTPGEGQIFLNISHNGKLDDNNISLHFSIADTGIGIAKDRINAIFGKYSQADKSTSRHYGGTGLGLSISKELAQLMNAKVGVESNLGQGSTFWLEIPLRVDIKQKNYIPDALLVDKNCLIIGGFPTTNNIIEELLNDWKMHSQILKQPQQGLDLLGQQQVNSSASSKNHIDGIIFCDIVDKAVLQKFSQLAKKLNVFTLVIIKNSHRNAIENIASAGINSYLFNPFLPLSLKQLLHIGLSSNLQTDSTITSIQSINLNQQQQLALNLSLNILLVEDNLINQKIAKSMIEKTGSHVDLANDGLDALNQWQQKHYDLIFMDCNLPEMDGYECTRKIRKQEQQSGTHVPIIALTANTAEEEKEKTLAAGMDDFLTKPINKKRLQQFLIAISEKKTIYSQF